MFLKYVRVSHEVIIRISFKFLENTVPFISINWHNINFFRTQEPSLKEFLSLSTFYKAVA